MNEKPKSIWKKSWKGPRGFLLWFIVLVVAAFAVIFSIGYVSNFKHPIGQLVFFAFLYAICWALVGTLVIVFIRWLCCWKNFRRFLFGLACFITLIALFYAEEDWRGKHDWEKFKRAEEAKGEKFDWQSIVPPPVPDDENFAFSPVWVAEEFFQFQRAPKRAEAWYGDRIYSDEVAKILPLLPVSTSTVVGTNMWNFPSPPENSGAWPSAKFFDLKPFQSYYRDLGKTNPITQIIIAPQPQTPAQDVLLALSKFDPVIEQLRQDSARPYSRFPIGYDDEDKAAILLPHLAAEKRYARVLQLRAIAELQNGQSEKALADVKLMLRLTDASRTEPFLISHLVRIAILQIALQPVWEGLAHHQWSGAQLAELDSELAKLDFLSDYGTVMRGERGWEIEIFNFLRNKPRLQALRDISNLGSDNNFNVNNFPALVLAFGPSGWLDQNELRLARFFSQWYLPAVNEQDKTISPGAIRNADAALDSEFKNKNPENVLESLLLPALGNAVKKFAHAQTSANLARVAIALERYRIARGNFPDSPDALAPKFISEIPHDVIDGAPLHYHKTSDEQFVLYSVGWNETDDGGTVEMSGGNTPFVDINKGDWVWRCPSKAN
jgi:hypothetical protein